MTPSRDWSERSHYREPDLREYVAAKLSGLSTAGPRPAVVEAAQHLLEQLDSLHAGSPGTGHVEMLAQSLLLLSGEIRKGKESRPELAECDPLAARNLAKFKLRVENNEFTPMSKAIIQASLHQTMGAAWSTYYARALDLIHPYHAYPQVMGRRGVLTAPHGAAGATERAYRPDDPQAKELGEDAAKCGIFVSVEQSILESVSTIVHEATHDAQGPRPMDIDIGVFFRTEYAREAQAHFRQRDYLLKAFTGDFGVDAAEVPGIALERLSVKCGELIKINSSSGMRDHLAGQGYFDKAKSNLSAEEYGEIYNSLLDAQPPIRTEDIEETIGNPHRAPLAEPRLPYPQSSGAVPGHQEPKSESTALSQEITQAMHLVSGTAAKADQKLSAENREPNAAQRGVNEVPQQRPAPDSQKGGRRL